MTKLIDFPRICVRRKRLGLNIFVISLFVGSAMSFLRPLKYEAVVGIEKRPAQISLQPMSAEYDVTRYTSEDERTIAVFKSRYMMLEWLKAIGISYKSPGQLERQLKKLQKRFILKPVNFTDLYMIRIQAETPSEAKRRTEILVKLFDNWDAAQMQSESEELIALLQKRLDIVKSELAEKRDLVKQLKMSYTVRLSGSTSESELDTDIKAKQNLYDGLTGELEKAERGMDPMSVRRVRVVIPLSVSEKPVYSRLDYLSVVFCLSLIFGFAAIFCREWQMSKGFRVEELRQWIASLPSAGELHNG